MYELPILSGIPPNIDNPQSPFLALWVGVTIVGCIAFLSVLASDRRRETRPAAPSQTGTSAADHALDRAA